MSDQTNRDQIDSLEGEIEQKQKQINSVRERIEKSEEDNGINQATDQEKSINWDLLYYHASHATVLFEDIRDSSKTIVTRGNIERADRQFIRRLLTRIEDSASSFETACLELAEYASTRTTDSSDNSDITALTVIKNHIKMNDEQLKIGLDYLAGLEEQVRTMKAQIKKMRSQATSLNSVLDKVTDLNDRRGKDEAS